MRILLLFILSFGLSAYCETAKMQKPFLFRVEKNGKISYILGSMHAGVLIESYPALVFVAYNQSEILLFEGNPLEFQQQYGEEINRRKLLEKDRTLSDILNKNSLEKLKLLFGESDFSNLIKYKPWSVEFSISDLVQTFLEKKTGLKWDGTSGFDMAMLTLTQSDVTKQISYLDDLSITLDQFEESFTAEDLDHLLSYNDPIEHLAQCALQAREAYINGDENLLAKYNNADCETAKFLEIMNRRTQSWIPKLDAAFSKGKAMAVFGAGHLYGNKGALLGLQKLGYKITRVQVVN